MPDRSQTASRSDEADDREHRSHGSDDVQAGVDDPDGPDDDPNRAASDGCDAHDPASDDVAGDDGADDDVADDGAGDDGADDGVAGDDGAGDGAGDDSDPTDTTGRFRKLDDAEYDRVNDFLRGYVEFTAREWAVARLCADFRTGTGVPMKTVGENLPEMVPFVTEPYTRKEVYDARRSFADRVRRAAATFLYGANSGFLAADEVDDVLYEAMEVATFLLEVEGTTLSHDVEAATEAATLAAMRSVHGASLAVRYDECPDCGARLGVDGT